MEMCLWENGSGEGHCGLLSFCLGPSRVFLL